MRVMGKDALDAWLTTRQKFHADHLEELLEAWSLYFSPAAAFAGAAGADGGAAVYDDAAPE
jgi:hypothetical protein